MADTSERARDHEEVVARFMRFVEDHAAEHEPGDRPIEYELAAGYYNLEQPIRLPYTPIVITTVGVRIFDISRGAGSDRTYDILYYSNDVLVLELSCTRLEQGSGSSPFAIYTGGDMDDSVEIHAEHVNEMLGELEQLEL